MKVVKPNKRSSEWLRAVIPAAPAEPAAQQSRQPSAIAELDLSGAKHAYAC